MLCGGLHWQSEVRKWILDTLTDGNLLLLEEEGSVLKDVKAENLVYLRMVCKEVGDRKRITEVCLKCNTSGESETIINSSATK